MNSQNWGGAIGFVADGTFLAAGDSQSVCASLIALWAEYKFTICGERTSGYSQACAGFFMCNTTLCYSAMTADDTILKYQMAAMALTWGAGATRSSLLRAAIYLRRRDLSFSQSLRKVARSVLPPVVSTLSVLQIMPMMLKAANDATSFSDPKTVLAMALFGWLVSDVLTGKLQDAVVVPLRAAKRFVFKGYSRPNL